MIYSGIDLVEIARIENSIIKNPRFIARVFSNNEQELFNQKQQNKSKTIAANFAAKEAFSKALGSGIRGFSLNEVEVLRDKMGAPYLNLLGNAKKIAEQRKLGFSVSLTHTQTTAAAVVIAFSV